MKTINKEAEAMKLLEDARQREEAIAGMQSRIKEYEDRMVRYDKALADQKKVFEETLGRQNETLENLTKERIRGKAGHAPEPDAAKGGIEEINKALGFDIRKL